MQIVTLSDLILKWDIKLEVQIFYIYVIINNKDVV